MSLQKHFFGLAALLFLITSCSNRESLQEYYINNQQNKDFVAIDIPTSMFAKKDSLNRQQLEILKSVEKINILAYPRRSNSKDYKAEEERLQGILQNDQYQLLMKANYGNLKVRSYFIGEEKAVDEFILFGESEERGFGVARVLGTKMKPEKMVAFLQSLQKGDVDMAGLEKIFQVFKKPPE